MYDYLDDDRKPAAAMGIICFVFAAAVAAAAGIVSYYIIWLSDSKFFKSYTDKAIWIGVMCFVLAVGIGCDIAGGVKAICGDTIPKAILAFTFLFGGVIPSILLIIHNIFWAKLPESYNTYSSGGTGGYGGSSGGTTGTEGKPNRPKYDRGKDPRIVKKQHDEDDDADEPKLVRKNPAKPKAKPKKFTKPGKPV